MRRTVRTQLLPIALTVIIFFCLCILLWLEIHLLNKFTATDIEIHLRIGAILVGLTIYLKTSIDFAIYIGRLMDKNPGTRGRIAIELGTALGNAAGTMIILAVWTFFKEIRWLLAIMILIAALVLLRLAEEGLEHVNSSEKRYSRQFYRFADKFHIALTRFNRVFEPFLRRIVPSTKVSSQRAMQFLPLLLLSFSVPFILGLDDFAGYVPLFNIVNVFGFSVGVFLGHMILNMLLYLSPRHTIAVVKNSVISLLGSVAFVGLSAWGFIEVVKLLFLHHS